MKNWNLRHPSPFSGYQVHVRSILIFVMNPIDVSTCKRQRLFWPYRSQSQGTLFDRLGKSRTRETFSPSTQPSNRSRVGQEITSASVNWLANYDANEQHDNWVEFSCVIGIKYGFSRCMEVLSAPFRDRCIGPRRALFQTRCFALSSRNRKHAPVSR